VKIIKPKYVRLEEELKIPADRMEVIEMKSMMTLKDILESRPYEVITISKDSTVSDAVDLMSRKNVSGLFVVDRENKLVGIFTERDIVRCVFNSVPDDETISGLTKREITIFDPSTAVSSAISTASRKKIRHLPVVEGGRIVGMVTFRDLVSYMLPEISFMAEAVH